VNLNIRILDAEADAHHLHHLDHFATPATPATPAANCCDAADKKRNERAEELHGRCVPNLLLHSTKFTTD
jgi:hypothetical protein